MKRLKVQLHHANVRYGNEINLGLGVPFLVSHARARPALRESVELAAVEWRIDPDEPGPPSAGDVAARVLGDPPDVAGFSLQPWCLRLFLDAIREIKRRRPRIATVVGGPCATLDGLRLKRQEPAIDRIFSGEGEVAFADWLEGLMGTAARPQGRDLPAGRLDCCGAPLREGLVDYPAAKGELCVEWTRGCPYRCSYCCWSAGRERIRRFSPAYIEADVAWARERGFSSIVIWDAAVNLDDGMLVELCDTLAHAGAGGGGPLFSAFVRWELMAARQAAAMGRVRWKDVHTGLQTDDAAGLRVLGRPPYRAGAFAESVAMMKTLGRASVDLITAVPGDTGEKLVRRVERLLGMGCRLMLFPLQVTPGTLLWKRRRALGLRLAQGGQFTVRETPAMGFDEYRAAMERVAAIGRAGGAVELLGYRFMGIERIGAEPSPVDTAARPRAAPRDEGLEGKVASLVAEWKKRGAGGWVLAGKGRRVAVADLAAWELAFRRGSERLLVAVFAGGALTSPVARGARLDFCPQGDGGGEAGVTLCRALAAIDRGG